MLGKTLFRITPRWSTSRTSAVSIINKLRTPVASCASVNASSFSTTSTIRADSTYNDSGDNDATQQSAASRAAGKASQLVNSLLHGSKAAKGPGDYEDVSETYSKMLARGKYVHELQRKQYS
jgi:hypothetical protein